MNTPQHLVWFDLPVRDLAKAITFYEAVTGWKSMEEHPGVAVFEHTDSGLGGCLYLSDTVKPSADGALLYFNVSGRHDEAEALVQQMDGEILEPKHAIGPFGFRTLILDPDGNRIALHSAVTESEA
jgi:uncharacterized protein